MPEVSRFYGIIIQIYFADHNPPHFHAFYGGDSVEIEIRSLSVLAGNIPPRALGLVMEWAAIHQAELLEAFMRAQRSLTISRINPLP
jgi:uncharacterized protein DUF4160